MKTLILSLVLSFSLFVTAIPRANAVVGLVVGAPVVMAVGGLIAVGGPSLGLVLDELHPTGGMSGLTNFTLFIFLAVPLGMLILDEEQESELHFSHLERLAGFSNQELAIYHSELDELNAINQTIVSELSANQAIDAKALWTDYGSALSPETLKIAAAVGNSLLNQIKK